MFPVEYSFKAISSYAIKARARAYYQFNSRRKSNFLQRSYLGFDECSTLLIMSRTVSSAFFGLPGKPRPSRSSCSSLTLRLSVHLLILPARARGTKMYSRLRLSTD